MDHNKLWKILKEMGISDPLTCLLRNLYAGQEATVRTGRGTTDWFQIGKFTADHKVVKGQNKRQNNSDSLYFLGLQKSLQMVTAAMKLKDACSLEEKL